MHLINSPIISPIKEIYHVPCRLASSSVRKCRKKIITLSRVEKSIQSKTKCRKRKKTPSPDSRLLSSLRQKQKSSFWRTENTNTTWNETHKLRNYKAIIRWRSKNEHCNCNRCLCVFHCQWHFPSVIVRWFLLLSINSNIIHSYTNTHTRRYNRILSNLSHHFYRHKQRCNITYTWF